jgi:AcrR family transcriptional regulator
MARPRNADGQRTRQAILDAALDLFGERGFFGTTLRDVASAVGVRESAIYNYFSSKEALFEALIDAEQDSKQERISAALDEPADDARTVLERLARRSLEDFASPRQRQLFRILMSDGLRLARAGRLNLVERMASRAQVHVVMQRFIDRGWLRAADPEMLALSFGAPLLVWRHLLALDADVPVVRDPEAFVRQHVDHFLRGAAAA